MKEGLVKDYILPVLKATLFALCLTLGAILLFALVVKLTTFSSTTVKIVNQFIKIVSVFLGCFIFVREGKGLLKGLSVGVLYALLVNLIFSLLSKVSTTFSFVDLVLLLVVGAISGIISVNLKEKA